jgi:hypothetical protein
MNNISNTYIMDSSTNHFIPNEPIEFVASSNPDISWMNNNRRIDDDDEDDSDSDLGDGVQYAWDDEFFKKFEWLKERESEKRENEKDKQLQKAALLKEFCKLLETELIDIQNEPKPAADPKQNNLYLYFISLNNNKMFLHADFKKDYDVVMEECADMFEYVQLHAPQKVVYAMAVHDLYDIDKHVKQFMHLFGIDDTRGGSYTEVHLPDYMLKTIEHERAIASFEHFMLQ